MAYTAPQSFYQTNLNMNPRHKSCHNLMCIRAFSSTTESKEQTNHESRLPNAALPVDIPSVSVPHSSQPQPPAKKKVSACQRILQEAQMNEGGDNEVDKAFNLTPMEIVDHLNKHIIGQDDAKRAVAVALRARWRRQQLDPDLQNEIHPVNILMIGPTGSGKTEVARRVANLAGAPFISVEVTRYTQVGVVGPNTDSIIKDLVDRAYRNELEKQYIQLRAAALSQAEDVVMAVIKMHRINFDDLPEAKRDNLEDGESPPHSMMRAWLREGVFDDELIDLELPTPGGGDDQVAHLIIGDDDSSSTVMQIKGLIGGGSKASNAKKGKPTRVKVSEAIKRLVDAEAARNADKKAASLAAIRASEENGIVFLDEFDKLTGIHNADTTRGSLGDGVQKELLSIIEGTVVNTKLGPVRTNHILFIASGAFHTSKPTDLMPELQGRLPVRVNLKPLTEADFARILVEPQNSLLYQQKVMMMTENVEVTFTDSGVKEIAKVAHELNTNTQNTGARRLQSVIAAIMNDISFTASTKYADAVKEAKEKGEMNPESVTVKEEIDAKYVRAKVESMVKVTDLSKYLL